MKWPDYVKKLIEMPSILDSLNLKIAGETGMIPVPVIIKVSIFMLEKMISHKGIHNVFVFPEINQTSGIFALYKTIFNIAVGKINKEYDLSSFKIGQKLSYKNCVFIYGGISNKFNDGITRIRIEFKNNNIDWLPLDMVPFLQKVIHDTKKISTIEAFSKVFRHDEIKSNSEDVVDKLKNYKTHLTSSLFYVAPVNKTIDFLRNTKINGENLLDILLVAHAMADGRIKNIGTGQLTGNPAIIIASDLDAVNNAIKNAKNNIKVQSIIIDISNPNVIKDHLDIFNKLIIQDYPIVCITDILHNLQFKELTKEMQNLSFARHAFKTWRWDREYLSVDLVDPQKLQMDIAINNCKFQDIKFIAESCPELSTSITELYHYIKLVDEQTSSINNLFYDLFNLSLNILRRVYPLEVNLIEKNKGILCNCDQLLKTNKKYLEDGLYKCFDLVIKNLQQMLSENIKLPKVKLFEKLLEDITFDDVYLIVDQHTDIEKCKNYWTNYCRSKKLFKTVQVLYPEEYLALKLSTNSICTVLPGWLKSRLMQKILFSFKTCNYSILICECEINWKESQLKKWKNLTDCSLNDVIIKDVFNDEVIEVEQRYSMISNVQQQPTTIDTEDVDLELQSLKFKKYLASGGQRDITDTFEAIPVSFIGDYLAFYKKGHDVITATKIIDGTSETIEIKPAEKLIEGDFVIVREAEQELIKEIADKILEKSKLGEQRSLSKMWKETLDMELLFKTEDEIIDTIVNNGCNKGITTIKQWFTDETRISPKDEEDIIAIGKATNDLLLLEKEKSVFEAGKYVRNAHIQAGKFLSAKLKKDISEELISSGKIDPYNIWKPVSLDIEDIGIIKILKVIDISDTVIIDSSNANKLLVDE